MTHLTSAALALLAVTLAAGCTSRQIVRFEDHPKQNETYVETLRHDNMFFTQSTTHEFWLCHDQESKLVCKRTCDGKTDLACPSDSTSVVIAGND